MSMFTRNFGEVDLSRAENALQSVACHTAADLVASVASELPLDVFRGKGSKREELKMPSQLEDPDGSEHGLEDWLYRVTISWLLRGNLFGDILETGPGNTLRQVALFHPDDVHPQMEDGVVRWLVNGREVPQGRMLHKRVNPIPGNLLGLSTVSYHAWTIGLSLTSTRFGLRWFQDGAHPSGILRNNESSLDGAGQAETAKARFLAAVRGTREPLVLGKGWEWKQIQISPNESQFLETQHWSAAECARMFGPGIPEILGYSDEKQALTYANIVDRDLQVLKYALNKWLRRLERLLSMFLPAPQYVVFNRDALLQTNTLQRYQAHASALDKQWKTVNDVREIEDMKPVPWGDQPNPIPGATPPADNAQAQEPAKPIVGSGGAK